MDRELNACAHGKVGGMNHRHSVQATTREHLLALPGDEMIRHAADSLTHAITVHCSRRELWPWLIQMGADRAGWYSYDMLDNGGRHSAEKILHGLQHPSVGAVFPALPGRRDGFVLAGGRAGTLDGARLADAGRRADGHVGVHAS